MSLQDQIMERMNNPTQSTNSGKIELTPEDISYKKVIEQWDTKEKNKAQNLIFKFDTPHLVSFDGIGWTNVEINTHRLEQLQYSEYDMITGLYPSKATNDYYRIEGVVGVTQDLVVVQSQTLNRLSMVLDKINTFDNHNNFNF